MTNSRKNKGFSLVEITIALGIAAFCLLAIFALLPTGMNTNRSSVDETIGANLTSAIVADLREAPAGSNSLTYNINPAAVGTSTNYLTQNGAVTNRENADYAAVVAITNVVNLSNTWSADIKIQAPPVAANPHTVFEAWTAINRD